MTAWELVAENQIYITEGVTCESLRCCPGLMVLNPIAPEVSLKDFLDRNKARIESALHFSGAILFRGFPLASPERFLEVVKSWADGTLPYTYRSTPRSEVLPDLYTSTEYPASLAIQQHNEHSYTNSWPKELWFYCKEDRFSGGETPIADSRLVYNNINMNVRARFENRNLLYIRNYSDLLDLPWQQVFQTQSRADVERYCDLNNISFSWQSNNGLQTTQIAPSTIDHPVTGERLWFNQAHLFHHSGGDPELKSMLENIGMRLPRNVVFENGTEIDGVDLDCIREAYTKSKQSFQWKKGDVLLLDNMLMTHGRNPYSGSRKILVAMTTEVRSSCHKQEKN